MDPALPCPHGGVRDGCTPFTMGEHPPGTRPGTHQRCQKPEQLLPELAWGLLPEPLPPQAGPDPRGGGHRGGGPRAAPWVRHIAPRSSAARGAQPRTPVLHPRAAPAPSPAARAPPAPAPPARAPTLPKAGVDGALGPVGRGSAAQLHQLVQTQFPAVDGGGFGLQRDQQLLGVLRGHQPGLRGDRGVTQGR